MKNPFIIAIASALITAGAVKAAPALAEAPETYVSFVKTADLDLSSQAGKQQLEARIAQAAREVCGTPSDADLVGQNLARQCRHDAIAQATSRRDALLAAADRGTVVAVSAAR